MSVSARNEQRRVVRIIPPRRSEESIVRHLFQEKTPAAGGGNVNFHRNQYRAPPAPLPNVERTLQEISQPQRTTTNSCIRLTEEANQFLMNSEMIHLLLIYQGVDFENPYSFMRDFEDVCSAFLSTGSSLHIICMVFIPILSKGKGQNMVSFVCTQFNFYLGGHAK